MQQIVSAIVQAFIAAFTVVFHFARQLGRKWWDVDPAAAILAGVMFFLTVFVPSRLSTIGFIGAAVCLSIAAYNKERWNLLAMAQSATPPVHSSPLAPTSEGPTVKFTDAPPARPAVDLVDQLTTTLRSRILSQDRAVDAVVSAFEGLSLGTRPATSAPLAFLMVGPTGTGKTQMAELTAQALGRGFYKVDMGNFKDKEGIWQLLGSPQGYIGGEGMLTRRVLDDPATVVLFDEIEKAHPEMFDWMLSLLDNGDVRDRRTDAVVSFSRTIVFFTSNLLTELPAKSIHDQNSLRDLVLQRRFLRPEFVARIGTIVPFVAFNEQDLARITEQQLSSYLSGVCQNRGISEVSVDKTAVRFLVARQDPKYGARNVQSSIVQYVEPAIREAFRSQRGAMTSLSLSAPADSLEVRVS